MKINADGNVDRETWPKTDLLGLPTYILLCILLLLARKMGRRSWRESLILIAAHSKKWSKKIRRCQMWLDVMCYLI